MKQLPSLLTQFRTMFAGEWSCTEYRQIDLYDKKKKLIFLDDVSVNTADILNNINAARLAQMALSDFIDSQDPNLSEGTASWQKYLALPRNTHTEKMVAEVFRILRILRIAVTHTAGRIENRDGLIRMSCTFSRCSLSLNITPAGLRLLGSFVYYYLDSASQPYSTMYVEWMLSQYFTDLVTEIRKFSDEDRVLFQFQQKVYFNRHFRFDCDNHRLRREDESYIFDIGKLHENAAIYPIDFFTVLGGTLYIVPVEAVHNGRVQADQMDPWKARCPDKVSLPAAYRERFGREHMIVGLPMT